MGCLDLFDLSDIWDAIEFYLVRLEFDLLLSRSDTILVVQAAPYLEGRTSVGYFYSSSSYYSSYCDAAARPLAIRLCIAATWLSNKKKIIRLILNIKIILIFDIRKNKAIPLTIALACGGGACYTYPYNYIYLLGNWTYYYTL